MQLNSNEIHVERQEAVTVLDIRGDITAFSETALGEAYQKANKAGAVKIVLKIEREAYINSGGIAVLIQILAQTRRNGQHVAITGISEHFKKIFKMVGITKFAAIFDSIEAAIGAMD